MNSARQGRRIIQWENSQSFSLKRFSRFGSMWSWLGNSLLAIGYTPKSQSAWSQLAFLCSGPITMCKSSSSYDTVSRLMDFQRQSHRWRCIIQLHWPSSKICVPAQLPRVSLRHPKIQYPGWRTFSDKTIIESALFNYIDRHPKISIVRSLYHASRKLALAFDIGTTHSGISYWFVPAYLSLVAPLLISAM